MATHKSVDLRHLGGMHFAGSPSSGYPIDFDDRTIVRQSLQDSP